MENGKKSRVVASVPQIFVLKEGKGTRASRKRKVAARNG
jgi:hypothetical protein